MEGRRVLVWLQGARSSLLGSTALPAPVSCGIVERGMKKRASPMTRPSRGASAAHAQARLPDRLGCLRTWATGWVDDGG